MEHASSQIVTLNCHPQLSSPWIESLEVEARRKVDGTLHLTYVLKGKLDHLRIPPQVPRHMGERLWEHTCFEVFIAREGKADYYEFNFAPSLAWAAQGFKTRRERDGWTPKGWPVLVRETSADRLVLDVELALDGISPLLRNAPLKLALAAVIEAEDGTQSYWALRHAGGKPDFHDPESFTLLLPVPTVKAGSQP